MRVMVGLTRFLLLCTVVLLLPALTTSQPTPLVVQRVWTRDTGGNDKAKFAPVGGCEPTGFHRASVMHRAALRLV